MPRVTLIDDFNEIYEMNSSKISVQSQGVSFLNVSFPYTLLPDSIRSQPSQADGWEIVVTADGETNSGIVTYADGTEFTVRHVQP